MKIDKVPALTRAEKNRIYCIYYTVYTVYYVWLFLGLGAPIYTQVHARQIRIIETRHNYMQTPPHLPFVPPLSISSFQVSHSSRWPTREPASLAACRESMNSQLPNFFSKFSV